MSDKATLKFFFNLGIEYFSLLTKVHGYGGVMAMIDDSANTGYEQLSSSVASDVDNTSQNQLVNDFQQVNLDSNEYETHSPSKVTFLRV